MRHPLPARPIRAPFASTRPASPRLASARPGSTWLLAGLLAGLATGLAAPRVAFAQHLAPTAMLAGATNDSSPQAAQSDGTAAVVPNSYLVLFQTRSFTLDAYRDAIYSHRPADQVAGIVADMEAAVQRDQAAFVAAVRALGGTVENQWWLLNAACVTVPPGKLAHLQALENVERVVENRIYRPAINTARDSNHHNAAAANSKRDKSNVLVRGKGISVAVIDTGADANMNGTNRPHRAYYPGGNPANQTGGGHGGSLLKALFGISGFGIEDTNGHGTFCAGCVGANQWPFIATDGMAPDAWIVSMNVTDNQGNATGAWLLSAWQQTAASKAQHNILVANNSFSGSPDLNDPVQQALDTVAYSSDVLVCVSAGNTGLQGTQWSQSAYNGLAVGSIDKVTLAWSSFPPMGGSAVGPLFGYGGNRTYPDIAAVGAAVNSTLINSESAHAQLSGTSFSSPIVAGIAALVRQAGGPSMTALEAKALLLATTNNENAETASPNSAYRNQKGLGVARADHAVDAALAGDVQRAKLSAATKVRSFMFPATQNLRKNVAIAWMRQNAGAAYNVDLRVYDPGNQLVGSDLQIWNSYAKVSFVPATNGQYRAEVTWVTISPGTATVEFAIAGAGKASSGPPTLTGIQPGTVNITPAAEVTLTGTNLDTVTQVSIGGQTAASFSPLGQTSLKFSVPSPFAIGQHNVTVTNGLGTSNPVPLSVAGVHPGWLTGNGIAVRGSPATYRFYGDKGWAVVFLASLSNQPSIAPSVVSLGLGNAFTNLFELGTLGYDARGYTEVTLNYPLSMPSTLLHFQGVPFDLANPFRTPFETTITPPAGILSVSLF